MWGLRGLWRGVEGFRRFMFCFVFVILCLFVLP